MRQRLVFGLLRLFTLFFPLREYELVRAQVGLLFHVEH